MLERGSKKISFLCQTYIVSEEEPADFIGHLSTEIQRKTNDDNKFKMMDTQTKNNADNTQLFKQVHSNLSHTAEVNNDTTVQERKNIELRGSRQPASLNDRIDILDSKMDFVIR